MSFDEIAIADFIQFEDQSHEFLRHSKAKCLRQQLPVGFPRKDPGDHARNQEYPQLRLTSA